MISKSRAVSITIVSIIVIPILFVFIKAKRESDSLCQISNLCIDEGLVFSPRNPNDVNYLRLENYSYPSSLYYFIIDSDSRLTPLELSGKDKLIPYTSDSLGFYYLFEDYPKYFNCSFDHDWEWLIEHPSDDCIPSNPVYRRIVRSERRRFFPSFSFQWDEDNTLSGNLLVNWCVNLYELAVTISNIRLPEQTDDNVLFGLSKKVYGNYLFIPSSLPGYCFIYSFIPEENIKSVLQYPTVCLTNQIKVKESDLLSTDLDGQLFSCHCSITGTLVYYHLGDGLYITGVTKSKETLNGDQLAELDSLIIKANDILANNLRLER